MHTIHSPEQFKTLSDPRRLAVLRLLMAKPATLTQLGGILGEHPAWVRHHLKQLEQAGLVRLDEVQVTGGYVEKYYRANSQAFVLQQVIYPEFPGQQVVVMVGSHDMALDLLARQVNSLDSPYHLLLLPVGSLEGLVALRQGMADVSGCHLLDLETGEYNLPYIRHIFPDHPTSLITLAHRLQGLILTTGNPLGIRSLADLARPTVRLINRNRGSGTRLWLEQQLQLLDIPAEQIPGYSNEVATHNAVAQAIQSGTANAGIGLAAAAQRFGLEFIPLFEERYDLVLPAEKLHDPRVSTFLDHVQGIAFRQTVADLPGYSTRHTGENPAH